jgi:hypothetical protein
VLVLAQEEFYNVGKENNGPSKLANVPLIFSSLLELYRLHKRVPPLLKIHEVIRAVSEIISQTQHSCWKWRVNSRR